MVNRPLKFALGLQRVLKEKFVSLELRVGSQAVELLGIVLFSSPAGCLTESGSDVVERPPPCLWHFEVGEDEEEEQEHDEDNKDVGTTQLL